MKLLIAGISGVLFGLGLAVSQMMDPAKVLGFLDVAGHWDPSLMLVMGGALAVTIPGYRWVLRRPAPWFEARFELPTRSDFDPALIGGAVLFGIGWGLVGLCPGPALAGLVTGRVEIAAFVLMMLFGYRVVRLFEGRAASQG